MHHPSPDVTPSPHHTADNSPVLLLTAPPPPGSHTYELDVYWSPGAMNNGLASVTAGTATITNNITTTTKTTYTYRDGGLDLKYSPAPMGNGNCMPDLCIAAKLVPADVVATVDLSGPGQSLVVAIGCG